MPHLYIDSAVTMSNFKCPVCSSGATRQYFEVRNSLLLQNVLYETEAEANAAHTVTADFWVCETCLCLFNPRFEEVAYSGQYNNDQSLSPVYRHHVEEVVSFLKETLPKDATILEIGCGNGLVLKMLHEDGYQVEGCDPAHAGGLHTCTRKSGGLRRRRTTPCIPPHAIAEYAPVAPSDFTEGWPNLRCLCWLVLRKAPPASRAGPVETSLAPVREVR
jgi:hypothetical protein